MIQVSRIFAPTNNRRLNELVGFLLCASALLLFLALASYSPLDPSLNSASVLNASRAARNWIGVVGALISDLALQFFGIGAFLLPVLLAILGTRWFRSRKIVSPVAKSLGAIWLLIFVPALAGASARPLTLDACNSAGRPARPDRWRCADSLLQSGGRLHRLRYRTGGRALSFDRILVRGCAGLGAYAFCLRDRSVG